MWSLGVYVECQSCKRKVYLGVGARSELSYSFTLRCPFCLNEYVYHQNEVVEERWDFTCTVCTGRFFIRNPPPRRVRCPHCSSLVYIDEMNRFTVFQEGQRPIPSPGTRPIAGALGGALLGGLIAGPIGALLGVLAGGTLGASVEYLEAKEE